jgi:hypothetical protein
MNLGQDIINALASLKKNAYDKTKTFMVSGNFALNQFSQRERALKYMLKAQMDINITHVKKAIGK